jgi:outer membrane lipase/esterase
MPRIRLLSAAVVLGLAANAAQAQQFSNVIVFGDSLSDAGNYVGVIPGAQGSFTTNPDPIAVELIADFYGIDLTSSFVPATGTYTGGWDFAWGGAQITHPFCVGGAAGLPAPPCQSLTAQVGSYFGRTGGVADPNALYSVLGGANDLFFNLARVQAGAITSAQAQANLVGSATNEIGLIGALQNAGARYIIVYNLPDVGVTPFGTASGAGTSITGLTLLYNGALDAGLAQLGDGIIAVDTYNLIKEVTANYTAYGFTNITQTACDPALMPLATGGSSLFCGPGNYRTPTANEDFLYADGVHPTGAAHAILAQAVIAEIAAPGQVSMLGEAALKAANDHHDAVRNHMFAARDADRGDDTVLGFAQIKFGNIDYDSNGWSPQTDIHQATLTAGADLKRDSNWRWGGAVSVTSQRMDIGSADVDGTGVTGSLYGAWDFTHGYIALTGFIGHDSFDIDRHIQLGAFDRVETGNTSASNKGLSLGGAWLFGGERVKHGPFADVTWQRIGVESFMEDSGDSTSMHFDEYDRDSTIGRIGYQLEVTAGRVRPYGSVAYNAESEDDQILVGAGLNTMNGHFTMPGFTPSDNWVTAELGVAFDVSDRTTGYVSYSGLFSDDVEDHQALTLGVRHDFGSPAVAVVPEEPAPAPDCSTLDDDGDGVNNCNDRCPDSPAGEGVGPDGCPVPALEPAPEPKPFRN